MEQFSKGNADWTNVSEVELVYKTRVKAADRPAIRCSKDTYELLLRIWNKNTIDFQEEFKVMLLNQANRVLGIYEASSGGITGTVADPRTILASAIKGLAAKIVLAHNHPSGNLKPSTADEQLTIKIKQGAGLLDIKVLDHIILTSEGYLSFADEGLL